MAIIIMRVYSEVGPVIISILKVLCVHGQPTCLAVSLPGRRDNGGEPERKRDTDVLCLVVS